MHPIGVVLILLFALGLPAAAQVPNPAPPPPEAPVIPDAKTLAANYELSSAIGDRKCPVTLDVRPAGPGFTLVYDKAACQPLFGFLNETVAWVPGIAGSIRFVNAAKRTVSEFTEGVGGRYEALRESDGVYFLANLQFVDPGEAPQFADLLGEWNLLRPAGPPICAVSLTDQATGEDTFIMTVKPGCDQSVTRFGPVSWVLDRGDIIWFSTKGERLRFGRQQEGGWAKVPDTPRPLLLARP
jgi:Protease inhibitor Inh